jgi:hypothetical protein
MFKHNLWMPIPPPYQKGVGLEFSRKLSEDAQRLSFCLLVLGWSLVSVGVLSGFFATILGSEPVLKNANALEILWAQKGLLCGALAIVLTGIGWQLIDRSKAATKAASVATQAIAMASKSTGNSVDGDRAAYEVCIHTKAAWLAGRMSHDRLDNMINSIKGPKKD